MAYLNAMDKHFFGKTLNQWAQDNAKFVSNKKVKHRDDSFEDLFKHFDVMYNAFRRPKGSLEKTPKSDIFDRKAENISSKGDSYSDFFGSILGQ